MGNFQKFVALLANKWYMHACTTFSQPHPLAASKDELLNGNCHKCFMSDIRIGKCPKFRFDIY